MLRSTAFVIPAVVVRLAAAPVFSPLRQRCWPARCRSSGESRRSGQAAGSFASGKVVSRKNRQRARTARTPARRKSKDDEDDPVIASFLQFLSTQMTEHPEDIVAADAEQLRRIGTLVEGVDED